MIHVIATITCNDGNRDAFIDEFKQNVPDCLAEDGCIAYGPTVDVDSGISAQGALRTNVVTVVEQWESLDALTAHLAAPHMATYREKVKDLVAGVTLQVLEPA
ncbi:MAG TPA: antibiotic biosynthesis monooxygenase [Candidatus Latescibacteria bacterium]|jgi:quinol monooxygenase YgiN|nr:antibiotic biosynthesis monooxygenase [Candidatus Latescibacterota bacterium]|tara:strand:+ start:812 stop:1120 length:309 start_codon:yes stop_codon:yes gene_type:complete